jgi:hypothetical protein
MISVVGTSNSKQHSYISTLKSTLGPMVVNVGFMVDKVAMG